MDARKDGSGSREVAACPARSEAGETAGCSAMEERGCRERCGACCIAPSISSPIPGMPEGKPAGVPCVQLDENMRCRIFGSPARPAVCASLRPSAEMCGNSREEALDHLARLEELTAPEVPRSKSSC